MVLIKVAGGPGLEPVTLHMSQDWRRWSDRLSFELAPYTYHFVSINFACLKIIQIFQQTGTLRDTSIKIGRLPVFMVL